MQHNAQAFDVRMPPVIDYNAAAATYDNTRSSSDAILDRLAFAAGLTAGSCVLDFGCGTGNYLKRLSDRFGCRCCGVEPSEGMRALAAAKSPALRIEAGNHAAVPFPANTFDLVYMTDVIHHVPDLSAMFEELHRVVKPGGFVAVVTESHAQIEARFFNAYFPSLVGNEKGRYPDVDTIAAKAEAAGLVSRGFEIMPHREPAVVSDDFIRNTEEKNFSMFRLLPDAEFAAGLATLKADRGRVFASAGGETIVWLGKPG